MFALTVGDVYPVLGMELHRGFLYVLVPDNTERRWPQWMPDELWSSDCREFRLAGISAATPMARRSGEMDGWPDGVTSCWSSQMSTAITWKSAIRRRWKYLRASCSELSADWAVRLTGADWVVRRPVAEMFGRQPEEKASFLLEGWHRGGRSPRVAASAATAGPDRSVRRGVNRQAFGPGVRAYAKYAPNFLARACFRWSGHCCGGPVKPSAQPTLVRTQHLPPGKTPRSEALSVSRKRANGERCATPSADAVSAGQRRERWRGGRRRAFSHGEYPEKLLRWYPMARSHVRGAGAGFRVAALASSRWLGCRAGRLVVPAAGTRCGPSLGSGRVIRRSRRGRLGGSGRCRW